ncbi:MAG: transposase family protein [Candidatus Peribacteraceae bacterium]|nr:transposase family protein [Candidatus Peribacteraceae bacterium]
MRIKINNAERREIYDYAIKGNPPPTRKDVAEYYGVSTSTVGRIMKQFKKVKKPVVVKKEAPTKNQTGMSDKKTS